MVKLSKKDKAEQKRLYSKMVTEDVAYEEPPARLDIKVKDLPEIKKWDVGNTYTITMKVKMISKSEGGYDGKRPLEAAFHVLKATNKAEADNED
jgi:hypothetical protein